MCDMKVSIVKEDDQPDQPLSGQQGKKEEQNYFPGKMPCCSGVSSTDMSHPIRGRGTKFSPTLGAFTGVPKFPTGIHRSSTAMVLLCCCCCC